MSNPAVVEAGGNFDSFGHMAKFGLGAHKNTISEGRVHVIMRMTLWLTIPTFSLTTALVKSSILVYLLQFTMSRRCIGFIYGTLVTVVLYCFIAAVSVMACAGKEVQSLNRHVANTIFAVAAFFNTGTDTVILLLPLWLVRPLQMPLKRKVGVGLVLMAGGFVVAISIQRVMATLALPSTDDIIYQGGLSALWGCVEIWSGILCACLPTLKPFIGHITGPKRSPPRYSPPPPEQGVSNKSHRMSGRSRSGDPWAMSAGSTRTTMVSVEWPEQAWVVGSLRRGMGSACTCTAEKGGRRQFEPHQMC
ncbi:hypothetical protein MGG_10713 [Pyricularia oryzae 70-15]|uniref:Rhodopsin domain-containing protein n=3 Tax=Pyricularia oryzae TaxID=318829 RepID=G4NIA3_PYRO7|nr:uncharacterized protein MGG_10713 [Pyricularia oryzae 70-15]EHA47963.1 hypothetical protein MGG_10713 [Pyricularia oryzae 70-15]ELQ41815.1 hypothetical protein OOU_Y34scaffold00251g1 [Pyricularia oryzae Y34]